MSEHTRTEQARNEAFDQWKKDSLVANKKCEDEICLSEYTAKTLDKLCRELETELNEAKAIIQDTLKELPVGHIPSHTPESIPERVKHYVIECIWMEEELNQARELLELAQDTMEEYANSATLDEWHCRCEDLLGTAYPKQQTK